MPITVQQRGCEELTLSMECKKGHVNLSWGCKSCDEKLKEKINWMIYLESIKK